MQAAQHMHKALLPTPEAAKTPKAELIVKVARAYGVSPLKQLAHIFPRMRGKDKMQSAEYYAMGLYHPKYSAEDRNTFVGQQGSLNLNLSLTPKHASTLRGLMASKTQYGLLLEKCGLAVTKTQAVVARGGRFGPVKTLSSPAKIADYLRSPDTLYPLFGKPCVGSRSIGSASIKEYNAENDLVVLGNGNVHAVQNFAKEVYNDFPLGFMFQDAVKQHPDMTAMTGEALGSIRIVTVNDGTGPQVLYTLWKIPSPAAMSDNFWQAGSMLCKVDEATGKTTTCIRGTGLDATNIAEHPVSKLPTIGFQLPFWEETKALAVAAHDHMPDIGVVGFDMGLSNDGPLVIESNYNPFHTLYQLATGEGIRNEKFMLIFDSIIAHQDKMGALKERIRQDNLGK